MKISTAAREYLIEIEVRKFTPKTIRSYRNNLNLFLRYCETEAQIVDIEDVSLTKAIPSLGGDELPGEGILRIPYILVKGRGSHDRIKKNTLSNITYTLLTNSKY